MQMPPGGSQRILFVVGSDDGGAHRRRQAREDVGGVDLGQRPVFQRACMPGHFDQELAVVAVGLTDSIHGTKVSHGMHFPLELEDVPVELDAA